MHLSWLDFVTPVPRAFREFVFCLLSWEPFTLVHGGCRASSYLLRVRPTGNTCPVFLYAYHNTAHSVTDYTPHILLFG